MYHIYFKAQVYCPFFQLPVIYNACNLHPVAKHCCIWRLGSRLKRNKHFAFPKLPRRFDFFDMLRKAKNIELHRNLRQIGKGLKPDTRVDQSGNVTHDDISVR